MTSLIDFVFLLLILLFLCEKFNGISVLNNNNNNNNNNDININSNNINNNNIN